MGLARFVRLLTLGALLGLTGCVVVPPSDASIGCVGEVGAPPAGLVEVHDDRLLAAAVQPSTKGGLCEGKVFQVVAEAPATVKVYRVWDRSAPYTRYGRWWSFEQPAGPRLEYRRANDICPSWSPLDQMSACDLKFGARIAVGPGQSAQCPNGELLPPSPANQVYVPNDSRNDVLWVESCTPGIDWPPAH